MRKYENIKFPNYKVKNEKKIQTRMQIYEKKVRNFTVLSPGVAHRCLCLTLDTLFYKGKKPRTRWGHGCSNFY